MKGKDAGSENLPNPCLCEASATLEPEKEPSSSAQKPWSLLGLLGILSFVFGLLLFSKRSPNQYRVQTASPQDTPNYKQECRSLRVNSISQSPPSECQTDNSNGSQENTPPWKKTAEICIAIGTVGLLFVNVLLWCSTKKVAETGAKEMELSERPWISLQNFRIESPLKFDSLGRAHTTIAFEFKDSGRSPAIRGFWQPDFFLQFVDTPSPVKKRDNACQFAAYRSTKVTDPRVAETWFPGDGFPQSIEVNLDPSDIADALQIPKQKFPEIQGEAVNAIYPDFVVCVAYRAAFTDVQYLTGYILELHRTNPKARYILPIKNGEIPAEELKLFIHPSYGIYAD